MMRIHLDIDSPMIMMMMTMMTLMTIMLMPSQSVQSVPLYQWILLQPPIQHLQSSVETIARSQKFSIYYILRSQNHSAQHHTQLRPVFWVSWCIAFQAFCIIVCCLGSILCVSLCVALEALQRDFKNGLLCPLLSIVCQWGATGNPKIFQLHFILACFDVLFIHENFQ